MIIVHLVTDAFGFPSTVDPSSTHALECPTTSGYYTTPEVTELYQKDMTALREQLREFFENKPFPTKFMYFVTRLDFYKPDPSADAAEDEEDAPPKENGEPTANKETDLGNYVSVYVAICGNGSVMVPMAIFPPTEEWHWERKKPVKLRHAYSMHRTKRNDANEALQFFAVTWKKFYDEEAKYSDKFVFLLDATLEEFRSPEFNDGLKQLEGHGKYWTTFFTMRNPLRLSHFEDILSTFVIEEWRKILSLKKSAQPNDYRKCVAFWFYTAWEFFAGDNARTAFRSCNMFLEDKAVWSTEDDSRGAV